MVAKKRISVTARDYQQKAIKEFDATKNNITRENRIRHLQSALKNAQEAAELFSQEGRYGPAKRMYKHAITTSYNLSKEYERDSIGYRNAIEKAEYLESFMNRANKDRLLNLGGYLQRRKDRNQSGGGQLESVLGAFGIIGIVLGLVFLSTNITGNVVSEINFTTTNIIGAVFILLGLICGFFYFKNKK